VRPLVTRDGLVGVLKIAARYPEQLKPYDAELVEHFRSQAAIAIQNLHRAESLRARVLTAERKHAMADLARSVSHDVNNALGSMLPLIQQMQADLRSGVLAPAVFAEDLEHVQVVPIDEGDQLLLYTDGVSEVLADADGRAEPRFRNTIQRAAAGGALLLDAILADVQHDLAGLPQPDDLTLLTARVLGRT
jgi:stage II sporulation SpoE-like protein